jgi:hypothetical protein
MVMSADGWDELLADARKALQEQEEINSELGDDMTPAPETHFMGRWRGITVMQTKRGPRDVYGVWDRDGKAGFIYQHARLVQEVDAEQPQVGDRVLILRGADETYEKDGQQQTAFAYVLRRQECSDPLPETAQLEDGTADSDPDVPF